MIKDFAQEIYNKIKDKSVEGELNLIGIRNTNKLKDIIHYSDLLGYCKIDSEFEPSGNKNTRFDVFLSLGTTTPSKYWLVDKFSSGNKKGTAILKEGFYKDCFKLGYHKGNKDNPALVQNIDLPVYRDKNKDNYLDLDENTIDTGKFGINYHKGSNVLSRVIGAYSAGCQVQAKSSFYKNYVLEEARKYEKKGQKEFNYNLFSLDLLDILDLKGDFEYIMEFKPAFRGSEKTNIRLTLI